MSHKSWPVSVISRRRPAKLSRVADVWPYPPGSAPPAGNGFPQLPFDSDQHPAACKCSIAAIAPEKIILVELEVLFNGEKSSEFRHPGCTGPHCSLARQARPQLGCGAPGKGAAFFPIAESDGDQARGAHLPGRFANGFPAFAAQVPVGFTHQFG